MPALKKQILVVDDEPYVLESLRRMLRTERDAWQTTYLDCPDKAWDRLLAQEFDAVVCDIKMPGTDGLQLLERSRRVARLRDLPIVMLTGLSDRGLKRRALDLGAADLLNKPVEREDLLARLRSVLRLKYYQDELRAANDLLEQRIQERTEELFQSRLDIIWRLGKAAEHRDVETGNHVIRVGSYSRLIAEVLGKSRGFVETLFLAAPLHDIGKIGIPDTILHRRGPLSPRQWERMKEHCVIGARILREDSMVRIAFQEWRGAISRFEVEGFRNPLLEMAASIALTHHEKWDGTGYPQGLIGEQIPLEARIVAISDVFDAVTSKRPYKEPYCEQKALCIIKDAAGSHFDPEVYAAFVKALPAIRAIRQRFSDGAEELARSEEREDEEEAFACGRSSVAGR